MPLAPTTYCEPLPASSSASTLHLDHNTSSIYSDDPPSISSMSSASTNYTSRRPPLPPISSHFHPRPLSKIAVIRPNSTTLVSRSPSPASSSHSSRLPLHLQVRSPSLCSLRSMTGSPTPRRIFPQESSNDDDLDLEELSSKEQAPVVFDASLNFVLGIDKQPVRQSFRPTASHMEPQTASSYLSNKISNFLQRTDHIMDEWKRLGRRSNIDDTTTMTPCRDSPDGKRRHHMPRSKSATNIMIKGYQYFSRASSVARSPSRPLSRMSEDDRTLSQCDEEVVGGDTRRAILILRDFWPMWCCYVVRGSVFIWMEIKYTVWEVAK